MLVSKLPQTQRLSSAKSILSKTLHHPKCASLKPSFEVWLSQADFEADTEQGYEADFQAENQAGFRVGSDMGFKCQQTPQ